MPGKLEELLGVITADSVLGHSAIMLIAGASDFVLHCCDLICPAGKHIQRPERHGAESLHDINTGAQQATK